MKKYDLIIVGAGIIGTFCAYHALKKGKSVLLLEKDSQPFEASFRNFGQAVPSGQSLNHWFDYGRKSLKIYRDIQDYTDISMVKNGSWYYASDDQEMTLLEEMHQLFIERDYPNKLFSAEACLMENPMLKKEYVKGGLYFPDEASLNPLVMVHRVREYLIQYMGLHYLPLYSVISVEKKRGIAKIQSANGQVFWADKIIIANGRDTQFLFPEVYTQAELKICKLQMMRLKSQKRTLKANILTGLSIRRYESFHFCPSYARIQANAEQQKLQDQGIHILFKQADDGSIILGDSHSYAPVHQQAQLGFEISTEINEMMLLEAKKILELESWEVESTWAGFYLQANKSDIFTKMLDDVIHIITGIGGKGMTTSPGFTADYIHKLY
ncbi:TIGR03364 family FAD-dependent oxidoreductase [Aquirufa rosea]|uniref:TIGR03364 family FAD-dependent oxidoreductase n=1 Tax=Aquirufa rosea TaxID=2509241 RepID=A0A4Q1BX71_9BACT|nr:TIGR03364 family FAD-dependent oxidoreductase [Aquirufa rosea]RXK46794.1 TIGR03364 family FAD-dependent oxidoreductase [Aquirufa rosea]